MNRKLWIRPTLAVALLIGSVTASAADDARSIVVNGEAIGAASLELLIEARREHGAAVSDELRADMRDELVTRMVLAQQARRRGLDADERVQAQNRLNELAVLSQAYLRDYADDVDVTDEEKRAAYRDYLEDYDPKEYKVRQILVRNEVTARELIARIEKGEDFARLAAENSIDPGADATGGDIGWFRPDVFVDQRLSRAVEKLAKGEYTHEPVMTRFGWHVVKVEDGPRPVKLPTYDELAENWKEKMRERVVMQKVQAHVRTLTEAAQVAGRAGTEQHAAR